MLITQMNKRKSKRNKKEKDYKTSKEIRIK